MRRLPACLICVLSLILVVPVAAPAGADPQQPRAPGRAAATTDLAPTELRSAAPARRSLSRVAVSSAVAPTPAIALRWASDDAEIARGAVSRSWTWGPQIFRGMMEPYAESPGGLRGVWYLDKARMEITQPDADATQPWFVTSGLLVRELMSGQLQIGDRDSQPLLPAEVPVAGDLEAPLDQTITYLDLQPLASLDNNNRAPSRVEYDAVVAEVLDKGGIVRQDQRLLGYDVHLRAYDDVLGHNIPHVFTEALPAERLLYIAGRPLTEPYWTIVPIGGVPTDVLLQAFERRVLTYTPSNPVGWQVEWGNVGRQYARWRYSIAEDGAPVDPGTVLNPRPAVEELARLSEEAARLAHSRRGTVAAAVLDLDSGTIYSINGSQRFFMFSTVKVPIMLGVLDDVQREGRAIADWEDQLMRIMIQQSNNDAATTLLESIGGAPALERYLREIGLQHTTIDRASWGYSVTTTQEMARLMARLSNCTILTDTLCRYALELMRGVTPGQAWGVSAGVPRGGAVALKNGWLPDDDGWAINSIGAISSPGARYTIAVYTRANPGQRYGIDTIEAISNAVYPALAATSP